MLNHKYLKLLSKDFPNEHMATGEIIRLEGLCEMPKGTEYFFSDIHGEDGAFIHLMRSASGNIRTKIRELYGNILTEDEQNQLANLIYDPDKIISILQRTGRFQGEWIRLTIIRLVDLLRYISSKSNRDEVRQKMPKEYQSILTEMLYIGAGDFDRKSFVNHIINKIVELGDSPRFIVALCETIQKVCVNHLHIIGDIFDRGKGPHTIMEELILFDKVDFQWGNHDVLWMGAAAGNEVCMCSVLRIGIRYYNFDALEDGYGINLRPLSNMAQEVYADDDCKRFDPKVIGKTEYAHIDMQLAGKMHKMITIIEAKLEGQLVERHPEYEMSHRNVLKNINFEDMTYEFEGKKYKLLDTNFPTVDPKDPTKLSAEEEELMSIIRATFAHSEPLHRHVRFLYSKGNTYKRMNNNLLFHGCVPMTEDGEFDGITVNNRFYSGKRLLDYIYVRMNQAYYSDVPSIQKDACDFMWYLWSGPKSPMFGKHKMATFERYFLADKELHKENYNPYYQLSQKVEICDKIFREFDMDPDISRIINGHVPVKIKDGETPVKANGKLFVIDGGISQAYQPKTGIAGYTLIFNSHHLALAEHHNFDQIENDMASYTPNIQIVEVMPRRLKVSDTDEGSMIKERIKDLKMLIQAFRNGTIKEVGLKD